MQAAMLLMMVACSTDFGDSMLPQDDDKAAPKASSEQATYEGEWTCDKQVIDTARLEVTNVLRLRLPEEYLRNLCFPTQSSYTLMGQPAELAHQQQGYTDWTQFYALVMPTMREDGKILYHPAAFSLKTADADYRVELWSKEGGNAIYRMDTNLWTICISVDRFTVINQTTQQQRNQDLPETVTLYYTAKRRIK